MAEIQKRIARGDEDAAAFLVDQAVQKAVADEAPESRRERLRTLREQKAKAEWWKAPASLVAVALVSVIILGYGAVLAQGGGHAVAGRVLVDEQTAGNLDLVFHSLSRSDIRVKTRTGADGTFAIESLPPGDYKILLQPAADTVGIPKKYSSPISTPFHLKLHEDTSGYEMSVASEQKARQG